MGAATQPSMRGSMAGTLGQGRETIYAFERLFILQHE